MTVPTAHTSANTETSLRRWSRPRVLAVLAVIAGSLGLSTSAFATSSAGTAATGTAPVVITSAGPVTTIAEPVVVYVSDAGQNIVELTPSGALVILVRYVKNVAVVRHEIVFVKPGRPKVKVIPAVTTVVTKTVTITKVRRIRRPEAYFIGWRTGNPNAASHPYWRFCDGQHGGSDPRGGSVQSWHASSYGDPGFGHRGGGWSH